jgi:multicomponent Na+:H+ antiporter subunit D
MIEGLHPSLILIVGGALLLAVRGPARAWLTVALPVLSFINFTGLDVGMSETWMMAGLELHVLYVDKMALLFGTLFHVAALIAGIYAMHVEDRVQHSTGMMYAGSAVGAVLAGDLMTLFIFWEMLAVTSVFQIWARKTARARGAGMRYLLMHVLSGLFLLAGAACLHLETGDLRLRQLDLVALGPELAGLAPWLILVAVGIKSCFPFVHTWLVDAYPEATPTGTVFLSAFTTKTAVYVLARTFAGEDLLIYVGATMAMFPIYFAVIENDLRRVLGYSMINQIGFMVVGIGIGTELAVNGAVAHAFNDVIFKGLLFMTMGAVLHRVGHCNGSDLGHLRKSMPFTALCCIVGAASISAFPLFSGFISKSMVMSGAALGGYTVVWLVLLFASAGVFHHAGIKIPFFAFFGHDHGVRVEKPPLNMRVAMGLGAVACIVLGSYPPLLYGMLPFPVDYVPYDLTHVSAQIQILCWSALAFTLLMVTKIYPPELHSTNLDADWFWRKPIKGLVVALAGLSGQSYRRLRSGVEDMLRRVGAWLRVHHSPGGTIGEPWPTGSAALSAAIMLAVFLLLSLGAHR